MRARGQQKRLQYNDLVASAVILQNTADMMHALRAIANIVKEGMQSIGWTRSFRTQAPSCLRHSLTAGSTPRRAKHCGTRSTSAILRVVDQLDTIRSCCCDPLGLRDDLLRLARHGAHRHQRRRVVVFDHRPDPR